MEFIKQVVRYKNGWLGDYTDLHMKGDDDYEALVCKLNASEVDSILKKFKEYNNRKGNIYKYSPYKYPDLKWFVNYTLRKDEDSYLPDVFRCTNKNVAARLYNGLLKRLDFHDQMSQKYCTVDLQGNQIYVIFGDY